MVYFNTHFYFKNYITKNIILIIYNMNNGVLFFKQKENIIKETFDTMNLMNEYTTDSNELLQDYSEAIDRSDQSNPLKNKNIKIQLKPDNSDPLTEFGYVNNVGVLRPYMDNVDYRSTTWGKYGCPSYLSTVSVPETPVKLNKNNLYEIETDPKLINMIFPMIPGQACGFEGENVYVDNIGDINNYTTEYKGVFTSTEPNVDDNSNLFNYDLCKTRAIDEGMRYFGLNNYDTSMTNSQCVVSNDINTFKESVMDGNIVYTSASVESAVDGIPDLKSIIFVIYPTKIFLRKFINNAWQITQTLIEYNTDSSDQCYNNGTFNVNDSDFVATWGGNCNADGYTVDPNNMSSYLSNAYDNKMYGELLPSLSYTIGTDGLGSNIDDVAYGCPKDFSISYKCGNVTKNTNMGGETWGQNVVLDCNDEYRACMTLLMITDCLLYTSDAADE